MEITKAQYLFLWTRSKLNKSIPFSFQDLLLKIIISRNARTRPASNHFDFAGIECVCEVKRMYLTFETFSKLWFPLLMSLGIYCLCDGLSLWCQSFGHNFNVIFQSFLPSGSISTRTRIQQGDRISSTCHSITQFTFGYFFFSNLYCL